METLLTGLKEDQFENLKKPEFRPHLGEIEVEMNSRREEIMEDINNIKLNSKKAQQ